MKSDFANLPGVLLRAVLVLMLAAGVAYSQKQATANNNTQPSTTSEVKKSTAPATKEEPTSNTTGEDAGNTPSPPVSSLATEASRWMAMNRNTKAI